MGEILPHHLEAEQTLLGAILVNEALFNHAAQLLRPEDFYREGHRRLFDAFLRLSEASRPIDPLTAKEELDRAGHLEKAGGSAYLAELTDGVHALVNVEEYARIIKDRAMLRSLVQASSQIIDRCRQGEETETILEDAEKAIFSIAERSMHRGFVGTKEATTAALEYIERMEAHQEMITGVPTGFKDLDNLTFGFQSSDLVILAARPSMGKTALALNVAQHAAVRAGKRVGVFSIEMSTEQLALRMICSEARVDSAKFRRGHLGERDRRKILLATGEIANGHIFIDDSPAPTPVELRSKARRLKAERGLDLLIIDYLQLIRVTGRFENRNQEVTYISRTLKELAKELAIPVLALSQLSRAPEQRRGDHVPQLADLRESGSLEQDADMVLFIYRPEYYNPGNLEQEGLANVILAKHRNGPTGTVDLTFISEWARFENRARYEE